MRWPDVEVVSWDVDGTLYCKRPMMARYAALSLRALLSRRGPGAWRELRTLARWRRTIAGVRARGGALRDEDRPAARAQLAELERRYYGEAIRRTGPRPGVAAAIATLREAGVRQVVVSDYPAGFKLEALGLEQAFERTFAGETIGFVKPARELFDTVARELDVAPSRILHLGDRVDTDGLAASRAGCQVAIFGRDLDAPDELLTGLGLAPRTA